MKKDLEEYEKELETMWKLYNTACGELQEKGYEMMKNGKMDVLLDFIKKKWKRQINLRKFNNDGAWVYVFHSRT